VAVNKIDLYSIVIFCRNHNGSSVNKEYFRGFKKIDDVYCVFVREKYIGKDSRSWFKELKNRGFTVIHELDAQYSVRRMYKDANEEYFRALDFWPILIKSKSRDQFLKKYIN